jgi:hypothetical protein
MLEISPHEKEIWKKFIFKKQFSNAISWGMGVSVNGWLRNSPIYHGYKNNIFYSFNREGNYWRFLKCLRGDWRLITSFELVNPRFPLINDYQNCEHYGMLSLFKELFTSIEKQLSFFNDMYLRSSFLPKELVARVFSFIRRCEIEKK